jgi:flavin reductase (DIM6/NTAB) family NADH-FMN oxidoreductase RutF
VTPRVGTHHVVIGEVVALHLGANRPAWSIAAGGTTDWTECGHGRPHVKGKRGPEEAT